MREKLKQVKVIYNIYMYVKEHALCILSYFSPQLVSRIRYRQSMGRRLNLKKPQEFNEKLMWLKLNSYYKNPLVVRCADKVKVREYVKEQGCSEILIENMGIYEKPEDLPWEKLPEQFVLKCNHGAGFNIICREKEKTDKEKVLRQLRKWMRTDYSLKYAEMQYHTMKRLILCEKYISSAGMSVPDDYKVYCFHGRAECIMVCRGRDEGKCKFYFFDRDWNWLKWNIGSLKMKKADCEKPDCLGQLLSYAEKLSKGFPFVRMDFYVIDNKVYFGEMTFTPCACLDQGYTELGNQELSKRLIISDIK